MEKGIRLDQIQGGAYLPQNLLVNGGFEIWQRGTSFPSWSGFTADEWKTSGSNISVTRSSSSKVGNYCLQGVAASTAYLWQGIEAGKSLEGLTLTLSVWVKTSTSGAVFVGIEDYTGTWDSVYSSNHSGSGNWERLTAVKTIRVGLTGHVQIPHSFSLYVTLGIGAAATAQFDGAMLVVGNYPEGVPFVPLDPATDQQRCERFYQSWVAGPASPQLQLTGEWIGFSGWWPFMAIQFRTRMYATPSITIFNFLMGGTAVGYTLANISDVGLGVAMPVDTSNVPPFYGHGGIQWDMTVEVP